MKLNYITTDGVILPRPSHLPLDIETYNIQGLSALDYLTSKISLIQAEIEGDLYIFDILRIGHVPEFLKGWIEDPDIIKIIHSVPFEYKMFLHTEGITLQNFHCTQIAEEMLNNGKRVRNNLGETVKRHCGVELPKDQGASDWGIRPLTREQVIYAFNDVRYLREIYNKQLARLDKFPDRAGDISRVHKLFNQEMKCLPEFCQTEAYGVYFNPEKVRDLHKTYVAKMKQELKEAQNLLPRVELTASDKKNKKTREMYPDGYKPPTSGGNFKDALKLLGQKIPEITDKKTRKVRESLSAKTYHLLNHPAVKMIQQYTETKKLLTSYIVPLTKKSSEKKGWIHDFTGRAHPSIMQTRTVTARPAYKQPPLQTVPKTKEFRDLVEAEGKNWVLIDADYSQIELRVGAVVCRDQRMIHAFKTGQDIHQLTAAMVNNIPLEKVDSDLRYKAKAINFGILFDQSAQGFQDYAAAEYGLTLELEECKLFKKGFLETYTGIRAYHYQVKADTLEAMWNEKTYIAKGIAGRRRYFPPGTIPMVKQKGKSGDSMRDHYTVCKDAINFPIQNGNAEIMKEAKPDVNQIIRDRKLRVKGILDVHDDMVFEAHKDDVKEFLPLLWRGMKSPGEKLLRGVPVEIEIKVGKNWGSMKEVFKG